MFVDIEVRVKKMDTTEMYQCISTRSCQTNVANIQVQSSPKGHSEA